MTETTQVHHDKVRAYLATDYRIGNAEQDIILSVGVRSERLAAMFTDSGGACGAFLTAYNPRGAIQPDEVNERRHAELAALLGDQGVRVIEGFGSEEGTDWPAEKSYFAFDLPLDAAQQIGRDFDQDAIVWVGADAVPQLILLR